MTKILLTGASGFVGGAVLDRLLLEGRFDPVIAVRRNLPEVPTAVSVVRVGAIDGETDWSDALADCAVVIHCAARVHVMNDTSADPLAAFRNVNVDGTLQLARQAAQAGVKRFVFLSSIKVNGEGTRPGLPYTADVDPAPADPYGISKMEAEQALRLLAAQTGMDVVIIRPTLVYGAGVKANFLAMMKWLNKGIPLPFGAIDNQRSLVAMGNLVDLILTCAEHPAAANETFLVSDGEDLSTTQLLRKMAVALGVSARLVPVPVWALTCGASLLGRKALSQRLCGSLQVDTGKTRQLLGWTPPVSVDQALSETARHFLSGTQ
ncbi:UDP-glucose 4-epimerase [Pseudomonas sp. 22 E 5]|jgi:nucleoside-diphosphate-sugar epimerase|uniref:UDP-glucose 4-epimerase family protein n=1 Tax=Pseudomonas sp. CFBP13506 TaxID=2184010 RepID=UPI000812BCFF|nr:SDR family oxidoreductase [Pseudomonas sp. CFBP13506]TKJ63910.1 NAD-dependent dehydratase [Pseudomonas sp. CFBP13506]CRM90048.1 UDP-glucose 4-epimerase [Pseudomonas sp. 22 E 5]